MNERPFIPLAALAFALFPLCVPAPAQCPPQSLAVHPR